MGFSKARNTEETLLCMTNKACDVRTRYMQMAVSDCMSINKKIHAVVISNTKMYRKICRMKAEERKTDVFSLSTDISLMRTIKVPHAIIGVTTIPIPRIKAYTPKSLAPR